MMAERRAGGCWWLLEAEAPPDVCTPERFSEEHRLIARSVRAFLAQDVAPLDGRLEAKDLPLLREVLQKLAALGVFAADVPPEFGGVGPDHLTSLLLAETVSRGSLSSSVGAHVTIGMLPIVLFGTRAQRARYLPRMVSGELIGAYALTESTAGSDALSLRTTADRAPDGTYRLTGGKQFITNGGIADVYVLYAKLDGKVTCFIVERGMPGFAVGPEEHKMGLRGSSTTSLFLDDVRVPPENVLGEAGRGHVVALNILNIGRLKLAAGCVGAAKQALRETIAYARERRQFGRPIATFGLIKQKIAEMVIRLYLAESMVYRAGGLLDRALGEIDLSGEGGGPEAARVLEEYAPECAINKVYGSEMLDFVVDEMVQIYGGYGFIEDYPAARAYRDARINRLYEGTNEINRLVIAGLMLRRAAAGRIPLFDAAFSAAERLGAVRGAVDAAGGEDESVLRQCKIVALGCLGRVLQRFGPKIDDQQEILACLSDQMIGIFAAESAVLRARQNGGGHGADLMARISTQAAEDIAGLVRDRGVQILAAVEDGEGLSRDVAGVHTLLALPPGDGFAVRRGVAGHVIEGGYGLGLPSN